MLRAGSIRLKERREKLYPVLTKWNIKKRLVDALLWAEETKAYESLMLPEDERPPWPTTYTNEQLQIIPGGIDIKELIEAGLITGNGRDEYLLTALAIKVFEEASLS